VPKAAPAPTSPAPAGAQSAAAKPPGEPPKPAADATRPAAAATPAAQAAAGGGARILIRLNGIDPPGQTFANKFVADYGKEKGVQVEIDYTDWASSFQKITTGIAGGTAPDIFMGGGLWTPVIAARDATLILDPYMKDVKDWEDWYPAAREDVTLKGNVHAIPYRCNTRGNILYRKSLFEKAGLDPKKPPTTWEEAQSMAAKLTQKAGDKFEVAGWHIVMIPVDLTQQYEDALFQSGGNYFNADRTAPTNSNPEGEEALQFWVDFVQKGVLPKEGMDSGVPNLHAYTAGKIALFPGWPTDIFNTKLNAPQILEDTIAAPPLKRKEQRLQLYIDKYMIFRRTKVADQAVALTLALVDPKVNGPINVEGSGSLPARKAQEGVSELYKDPRWKVIIDSMKYGKPRQIVPQHFDVQPAMGRQVEAAVKGVKTVKQALKDMDEEVSKILKS
jgi:multiple sugar transport system substrate-binding protein